MRGSAPAAREGQGAFPEDTVSRSASQPRPQHHAPIHTLQLPVLNKHDLVVGMMCAGGSWPPPGLGPGCWRGRRRRR